MVACLFNYWEAGFDGLLNERCQFDPRLSQFDRPSAESTQIQKVIDQSHHLRELSIHHVADLIHYFRVALSQSQDLQSIADWSQRIAKLVRQCRQELVLVMI